MCGIIAHIAFDENKIISQDTVRSLNNSQRHRGLDDEGVFLDSVAALAIRRLSIVDLKGGHQPIVAPDQRYAIVFNGEIYNHKDLRRELETKGIRFLTHSDTEVLLQGYIHEGAKFLERLNGMFAFAIWDKHTHELFVARDRLGIKPLYFAMNQDRALFSSELMPIIHSDFFELKINLQAIADYLSYWYVCEPQTIYQGVFQLAPGHYGILKDRTFIQKAYWQLPQREISTVSLDGASETLQELLVDAIKIRIPDEVAFGTFLSGGIDSGLITALCARQGNERLKAFSIGFNEDSYSEVPQAMCTAKRNRADLFITHMPEITPELIEQITSALDEPLGNASYIPTYILAQSAARNVKVVLTGDGGDELFGGYPTYQAPYYQSMYRAMPTWMVNGARSLINRLPVSHGRISLDFRLKQFMRGASLKYPRAHHSWREIASKETQESLLNDDVRRKLEGYDPFSVMDRYFLQSTHLSVRNQLMYADINTFLLNDHLRKVDRMTMAHSLEARLPFLDYRIVEFAMKLPAGFKVNFWKTKIILKQIAKNYLSSDIIRGKKKGLTSPIASWLSHELKEYVSDILQGGIMAELFNENEVKRVLKEHHDKIKDNSRLLWALLVLQLWHKKVNRKQDCLV